jgi:Flp pilus assembly secretin CpaC
MQNSKKSRLVNLTPIVVLSLGLIGCASLEPEGGTQNIERTILRAQASKAGIAPFPAGKKSLMGPALSATAGPQCEDRGYALNELAVKNIGLSNRDAWSVHSLLSVMGYNVISSADVGMSGSTGRVAYRCADLPLILIPDNSSEAEHVLAQQQQRVAGTGDLSIAPLQKSNASDSDQIIVFYHDSQRENVLRLQQTIRNVIDIAAPQVYIETMVLEVSTEDSKELGVSYITNNIGGADGNSVLSLGGLEVGETAAGFIRDTTTDVFGTPNFIPGKGIQAEVRALVDKGKAEVLARPSILALSNRQAVIQIVDVIQSPVVQSSIGGSGELVISAYRFEPQLLGITLNLRPRVSADRQWVSMEIDAVVEAEIDENSGAVFAPDGDGGSIMLAEKKGASSRKVKTSIRIPDRTPIVIGGLVAGSDEKQQSRVPGFGDIPYLGGLFGATDNESQKREIVIVITPHILAEDAIGVRANRANASVMKRQSDLMLFKNFYRVADSDVFDMNFLLSDPQFVQYRKRALELGAGQSRYANDSVVKTFVDQRIPGDDAIVSKMIFDIVAADLPNRSIDLSQVFIASAARPGSSFLSLAEVFDSVDLGRGTQALEINYGPKDSSDAVISYRVTHVAEQSARSQDNVAVIRTLGEKERFLAAIATDIIIRKNGGFPALNLQSFSPGTTITLDSQSDHVGYQITSNTLRNYYRSTDFDSALRQELQSAYRHIDQLIEL